MFPKIYYFVCSKQCMQYNILFPSSPISQCQYNNNNNMYFLPAQHTNKNCPSPVPTMALREGLLLSSVCCGHTLQKLFWALCFCKYPSSKLIARLVRQVIPGTEPPHLCLCFWRPHCVLAQEAVFTDVSGLSEPQSTLVLEF